MRLSVNSIMYIRRKMAGWSDSELEKHTDRASELVALGNEHAMALLELYRDEWDARTGPED